MARLEVDMVGQVGLVSDIAPAKLEKNIWTTLRGAVARDSSITVDEFLSKRIIDTDVLVDEVILGVFSFLHFTQEFYVLCMRQKVLSIDPAGTLRDITPTGETFASDLDLGWSGFIYNGILILNNAIDPPLFWAPTVVDGAATELDYLSNAPGADPFPANWSCHVITEFNHALFAMNITDDTDAHFPYLIMYSDFAEPGTLPAEWTATNTNSAGDFDIPEGFDHILDSHSFKDILVVWKERSCWGIRFTGGNQVYKNFKISSETGILARNCLANTDFGQYIISKDDLVVFEGNQIRSIANRRTRRGFFADMNNTTFKRSWVFHNSANTELWFVKPTQGSDFPNIALIHDYGNDTWYEKEFHGINGATLAFSPIEEGETWDGTLATTTAWEDYEGVWNPPFLGESSERTVMAGVIPQGVDGSDNPIYDTALYYRGRDLFDGDATDFNVVMERMNMPFPRGDKVDWSSVKQVQYVVPKLQFDDLDPNFEMKVSMGFQMEHDDPIRWVGPKIWTPSKRRLFFDRAGKFIHIKFEIDPAVPFTFDGYDVEFRRVAGFGLGGS